MIEEELEKERQLVRERDADIFSKSQEISNLHQQIEQQMEQFKEYKEKMEQEMSKSRIFLENSLINENFRRTRGKNGTIVGS